MKEVSRSKIRKGMEERRRDCASKREARPPPEMRIGFRVVVAIVVDAGRFQDANGEQFAEEQKFSLRMIEKVENLVIYSYYMPSHGYYNVNNILIKNPERSFVDVRKVQKTSAD